jgi:hypothetical protein
LILWLSPGKWYVPVPSEDSPELQGNLMNLVRRDFLKGSLTIAGGKLAPVRAALWSRLVVFKGNGGLTLEWRLRVQDKLRPWIAVASADSAPDLRQEAFGRLGSYPELA